VVAKRRILIKMMFLFIQLDQDFYPGRRKRGKDYEDGMYELPFYYPGMVRILILSLVYCN
jgi:hypothetical protein